jgi:hypothetical protein
MATQCKANTCFLLSVILPLLLCGVLSKEAEAAAAGSEGGCPFIIGVASTEGRPDIFKSYIGGQWRTSSSGRTLKVLSPVNETTLFEVQVDMPSPDMSRELKLLESSMFRTLDSQVRP